ncbi:MAG TPA: F0F1 ATP synthase subunit epsilon [Stellaceae bacterium]|jgi:F-type H+-transporting ATPase subunit epsilon
MAEKVQFELVSPERLVLSEAVDMVVVPGGEGYFGVLANHAPLISTVKAGVIDVYQGREVTQRIFVAGGFAEVTPERCTVLADEAVAVSSLDPAAIEANMRILEGTIANLREQIGRTTGTDRDHAEFELRHVQANLEVAAAKLAAVRGGAAVAAAH